jgi:hypothetical protein
MLLLWLVVCRGISAGHTSDFPVLAKARSLEGGFTEATERAEATRHRNSILLIMVFILLSLLRGTGPSARGKGSVYWNGQRED